MPGDAACGVPLRPSAVRERATVRWLAERLKDRGALGLDRGGLAEMRLRQTDAELSGIRVIGLEDVADHLVAVAATAARAFPERFG